MKSFLNIHWKDWCWSWNSNTLAIWCEELTHWKRSWCWERLKAGGEGDDRGWDGLMVSLTLWTQVWVNSGRWWWTGKPGVPQSMGSQRVGRDWATELNRLLSKDSYWIPNSLLNTFTYDVSWAPQMNYTKHQSHNLYSPVPFCLASTLGLLISGPHLLIPLNHTRNWMLPVVNILWVLPFHVLLAIS